MPDRRHQLIILGTFQRRIILGAILGGIFLINLVLIIGYLLDPQLLSRIDTLDTAVIAIVELAIMGLIFYFSLLASNKIAGPMYAFDKVLQRVRGGDLTARLHLRHGDIFVDVADEMNQTLDALSTQVEQLKATLAQLKQLDNQTEQQALLDELQAQLEKLKSGGG